MSHRLLRGGPEGFGLGQGPLGRDTVVLVERRLVERRAFRRGALDVTQNGSPVFNDH